MTRITEQSAAETISDILMTGAPARGPGVGIVGVVLRVFNAKVVEINGLIGLDTAERHHHIHKEPNAALMAGNHQGCDIHVCSG